MNKIEMMKVIVFCKTRGEVEGGWWSYNVCVLEPGIMPLTFRSTVF
jgi:hypothetical protein